MLRSLSLLKCRFRVLVDRFDYPSWYANCNRVARNVARHNGSSTDDDVVSYRDAR